MKTFKDYQALAARTSGANGKTYAPSPFGPLTEVPGDVAVRIETCSLGLIGELGELADHVKKVVGHGHALDRAVCLKELGDVAWYVAEAYSMLGLDARGDDIDGTYDYLKTRYAEIDAKYKEETGLEVDNLQAVCSLLRKMSASVGVIGGMIEGVLYDTPIFNITEPGSYSRVVDDLGDMLLAVALRLGLTFREVLEANVEKLRKRYPDGFKSEDSINRKE